jgi:hypothetical protein
MTDDGLVNALLGSRSSTAGQAQAYRFQKHLKLFSSSNFLLLANRFVLKLQLKVPSFLHLFQRFFLSFIFAGSRGSFSVARCLA